MPGTAFTVKALFDYTSDHEDDLNFSIGQIITVTEEEDDEWYFGKYTDDAGVKREGIFPRNFVERYEPPAPPRPSRPSRPRKEPEPALPAEPLPPSVVESAVAEPAEAVPEKVLSPQHVPEQPQQREVQAPEVIPPASPPAVPPTSPPLQPREPIAAQASPKPASKAPPPQIAEKPTGNSFKDRIAAFNKSAAPPITPFGQGAPRSNTLFIKKPFVAPPPSKDAYIPPPVQQPQKIYRREEAPDLPRSPSPERATFDHPPVPAESTAEPEEEQPKPVSLKERIALLHKQQLEQAARHAEAAQKKEKPKKPAKKRAEVQEPVEYTEEAQGAELERTETSETAKEPTTEAFQHDDSGHARHRAAQKDSPTLPSRELTSDTNDADNSAASDTEAEETSTGKEDVDEQLRKKAPKVKHEEEQVEEAEEEQGEEEEEEMDPEVKRRMELRDRMAKMSGGMGMMGMFGPPGGLPPAATGTRRPKPPAEPERRSSDIQEAPAARAPPIPLMALPGMHAPKPAEPARTYSDEEEVSPTLPTPVTKSQEIPVTEELAMDSEPSPAATERAPPPLPPNRSAPVPPASSTRPAPPPVPSDQPAPPVPRESRPVPTIPSRAAMSPSMGEESDDELSAANSRLDEQTSDSAAVPTQSDYHEEVQPRRSSAAERRISRGPPPPPPAGAPLSSPVHTRPPPPPPPGVPSRKSTSDSRTNIPVPAGGDSDEEVTEYDGDYDTDIASGVKHKDALKAHARDSSLDDGTITDDYTTQSPRSPHETRPPIPGPSVPRGVPPPPPTQLPKSSRKSADMPRVPPPPIPPPKEPPVATGDEGDDEYDPFRYTSRPPVPTTSRNDYIATARSPTEEAEENDLYSASPRASFQLPPPPPFIPPPERSAALPPPPPPPNDAPAPPPQVRNPPRQSMDALRGAANPRRSMDVPRPAPDQGHIASDVDLGEGSLWWTQPNTLPPVFRNRRDILYEIDESSSSVRGGSTTVSKDVYVLFIDYSQTVISVQFGSQNPAEALLEQRHEPPPQRLRQDQLEDAHSHLGIRISEAVHSKHNTTVGDGTPHGLVRSLLEPLSDALLPVGVRAYGALVYSNLANASVQQFDEIRAGDIVTFRNARFQGHKGTMHQRYNAEVGKPDHVGIVVDWDGTKKKIRAWEQGRESKKVKVESFKLSDLKSGECRVWRVMPRNWIGWDSMHKA
ncbi:hypothetical protein AJ80_03325 [Polytolypa hystricis UAMH7299]|uniref:SH3 domain-containing protein n=1 Tax=Polytolypa hystricis (strain UAMH7299) TaxID=1447883 RepID=A0A2B7YKP7_POLH7|nr:hypothetical protein AJ80_03325 [Polytolypa hystricis UAMH7299]